MQRRSLYSKFHSVLKREDGQDLIELLQQRAEQWAAANLVTMVFNSDDYWVYERLKKLATRMEVTSITDLPRLQAIAAISVISDSEYRTPRFHCSLNPRSFFDLIR